MFALARLSTVLVVEHPRGGAALHAHARRIFGTLWDHEHLLLKFGRQVHTVEVRVVWAGLLLARSVV